MVGTVVGATLSGRLMTRVTRYKRLPVAGLAAATAAAAALMTGAASLPLWAIEAVLVVVSLGLGTLLPVSTVAIQNAVLPHQLGTATGAANFFRSLGGAIIVAAFGAIVFGLAAPPGGHLTPETLRAAGASGGVLAEAFRWVFAAATLGFALSLAFLLRMEERPLKGAAG
jgi:MFS family permease